MTLVGCLAMSQSGGVSTLISTMYRAPAFKVRLSHRKANLLECPHHDMISGIVLVSKLSLGLAFSSLFSTYL